MADLKEEIKWENGIYQLETVDLVVGGVDGISNKQAKQLANRTSYLKKQVEDNKSGADLTLATKRDVSDSYSKTEVDKKFTSVGTTIAEKLDKTETAADSTKLGGLAADKYAKKDDIPAAPQAATETEAGIVKLKNSITGSLADTAVSEKAAKEYMDKNASIGIGQTWQEVTSERHTGVTYTNTTGRPIFISVYMNSNSQGGSSAVEIFVDDKLISGQYAGRMGGITVYLSACAIVPSGSTYSAKTSRTLDGLYQDAPIWMELR